MFHSFCMFAFRVAAGAERKKPVPYPALKAFSSSNSSLISVRPGRETRGMQQAFFFVFMDSNADDVPDRDDKGGLLTAGRYRMH